MIMPLSTPKKHVFFKKSADRRTYHATIGREEIGGVFPDCFALFWVRENAGKAPRLYYY